MAIRFVIGSEGSGAKNLLQEEMLLRSEEAPDRQVILIVPDQATLQAQKELVAKQKNGCVMNLDILSFSRLKYRLSEELGDCFPPILDDIGKSMLLKKVLLSAEGRLRLYNTKHKKSGFLAELKSMISELQRYLVDADRLKELSGSEEDPILRDKLADLSLILSDFRSLLGTRFLTEEDIYSAMCAPVERSKKLRGAEIYLYGFTGFTPSQFLLLRSLMKVSNTMTIALTMDRDFYGSPDAGESVFRLTQQTINTLRAIAKEEQIPELPVLLLDNPSSKDALSYLQNHIFRRSGEHYEKNPGGVRVVSLPSRSEEIRYLLSETERLTRYCGYRYRDIAVICGDVQSYAREIEESAEKIGIPCFIDYKTDVMNDPLIDLIRSLFSVLKTDFRMDAVTHYMKNCLSGFTKEEACLMENYLLAKGIRGASSYRKPFRYRYRTVHKEPLERVNAVRERLADELMSFFERLRNACNVTEAVKALYDFLLKRDCYRQMEALADSLSDVPGRKAAAKSAEFHKIYEAVMELLDNFVMLMGDVSLDITEIGDVLEAGFTELKLGRIPPEQDCITVGDVKRSRLEGVRSLFLLGVNEGDMPAKAGGSEILTDRERESLLEKKVVLSDIPKDSVRTEEFYIYLALSKPSEQLTVCYHRLGDSGRETKPSYVVYRILGLLNALEISNENTDRSMFAGIAGDHAKSAYLRAFSNETVKCDYDALLRQWFVSEEGLPFAPVSQKTAEEAKAGEPSPVRISPILAAGLYGNSLKGGVTMMERYAECGFRLFLERGLILEERPEYEADYADIGSVMHEAMARFGKAVTKDSSFRLISENDAKDLMERIIGEVLSEDSQEVFRSDRRNSYIAYRMKEILLHMTEVIREQLKSGRFEPADFERKYTLTTEHAELHGRIDRIDTCRNETETLVKITDYKTSDHALKYEEVYAGISAQLPLYMKAVIRDNPSENVPAAMLYSLLDDPYVDAESEDKAEAERKKAVCPDGVILDEKDTVCALDNRIDPDGKRKSDIIPVSPESMLSREEIEAMMNYAERLVAKEAEEILSGNIRQNPMVKNRSVSCSYCPYTDFCTKRIREEQKMFRSLPKMKKSEFFEKAGEETHD